MSSGQGFATQDQPPAPPLSPATNYYAGIGVTIMFLLGVLLLLARLRARGRKFARPAPYRGPRINVQRGTVATLTLKKRDEARRQSA